MIKKVSALYVREDSIYKKLNVDCWDIERDARLYNKTNPVICHPPCRSWGKFKGIAKPRPDEKQLAITAINQVRTFGGVLEHPSGSSLWKTLNLPMGRMLDQYGGFTISVNQHWFGHKAEKKTLLYICGTKPGLLPDIPLSFDRIDYTVSCTQSMRRFKIRKKEISKREREETPIKFALWLIELAKKCTVSIHK